MRKYGVFIFIYLAIFAIFIRFISFPIKSVDFVSALSVWYNFILHHGGITALKYNFTLYTPAYLYLLAITTYIPIYKLFAIKIISTIFDLLLAFFVFKIVHLKYENFVFSLFGFFAVLLLPPVVLNSAVIGQCDSIYTSFLMGSLYFIL